MVTKVVKVNNDSSAGILAIVLVVLAVAVGAYALYNQGYLGGDRTDINVNLPGGKTISGSVSE